MSNTDGTPAIPEHLNALPDLSRKPVKPEKSDAFVKYVVSLGDRRSIPRAPETAPPNSTQRRKQ